MDEGGPPARRRSDPLRILELGSYLAPAYAGMILAEQGHHVEKWTTEDPILSLRNGEGLWKWVNHRKIVVTRPSKDVSELASNDCPDIIIDNHLASTWDRWGVSPSDEAARLNATWVSLRGENDESSFDLIAQARAWGDLGILPFYIGDTAAGLWLAFKALASDTGHHIIRQAAVLAKLREGELCVTRPNEPGGWDRPGDYEWDSATSMATVHFKGNTWTEPARSDEWRRQHLRNDGGRYIV